VPCYNINSFLAYIIITEKIYSNRAVGNPDRTIKQLTVLIEYINFTSKDLYSVVQSSDTYFMCVACVCVPLSHLISKEKASVYIAYLLHWFWNVNEIICTFNCAINVHISCYNIPKSYQISLMRPCTAAAYFFIYKKGLIAFSIVQLCVLIILQQ